MGERFPCQKSVVGGRGEDAWWGAEIYFDNYCGRAKWPPGAAAILRISPAGSVKFAFAKTLDGGEGGGENHGRRGRLSPGMVFVTHREYGGHALPPCGREPLAATILVKFTVAETTGSGAMGGEGK